MADITILGETDSVCSRPLTLGGVYRPNGSGMITILGEQREVVCGNGPYTLSPTFMHGGANVYQYSADIEDWEDDGGTLRTAVDGTVTLKIHVPYNINVWDIEETKMVLPKSARVVSGTPGAEPFVVKASRDDVYGVVLYCKKDVEVHALNDIAGLDGQVVVKPGQDSAWDYYRPMDDGTFDLSYPCDVAGSYWVKSAFYDNFDLDFTFNNRSGQTRYMTLAILKNGVEMGTTDLTVALGQSTFTGTPPHAINCNSADSWVIKLTWR